MATCQNCGKHTNFGHNIPWSKKKTRRTFSPNLQTIAIWENGRKIQKTLCTRCIRSLVKTAV